MDIHIQPLLIYINTISMQISIFRQFRVVAFCQGRHIYEIIVSQKRLDRADTLQAENCLLRHQFNVIILKLP